MQVLLELSDKVAIGEFMNGLGPMEESLFAHDDNS